MEAVDNAERKVLVQRLDELCDEVMTEAFGKREQIYSFADEITDTGALKNHLESWLNDVTVKND